jgi:hypothetical protein
MAYRISSLRDLVLGVATVCTFFAMSEPAQAGWKTKLLIAGGGIEGIELVALDDAAAKAAQSVGTPAYYEDFNILQVKIERHPVVGLRTAEAELKAWARSNPRNVPGAEKVLADLGVNPAMVLQYNGD